MVFHLNYNLGFTWYTNQSVYVKGYGSYRSMFYSNETLLGLLAEISSKKEFLSFLNEFNGVYTIVIVFEEETFVVSDITRAFPLFYTVVAKKYIFSDDITFLKDNYQLNSFDELSVLELKNSLHTYGDKTLLDNVYQVEASQLLHFKNEELLKKQATFFYITTLEDEAFDDKEELKQKMITTISSSFKRMIVSLKDKNVALPLSGGYDSRLIAVMLKEYGVKNVLCYTYGRRRSKEIENSKKTAEILGYDWFFVEYNKGLLMRCFKEEEFAQFCHYAGKFSSMPNPQEYFAVKYLKENNLVNKETVFIPGYAGDLLGGSQYGKVIPRSLKSNQLLDLVCKSKFYNKFQGRMVKDRFNSVFSELKSIEESVTISSQFEDFDIKEKIAKYIFNSASFYTYLGFEFRFPFWDKEMLMFFRALPSKYKYYKILFDEVVTEFFFEKANVNFNKELQVGKKELVLQKIKNVIKPILPNKIKAKYIIKNDWIGYEPLVEDMLLQMKNKSLNTPESVKELNAVIAAWYVYLCKNKL